MLMSNFLKNRKSIREYKDKAINEGVMIKLLDILKELEEESNSKSFNFIIFKDGERCTSF